MTDESKTKNSKEQQNMENLPKNQNPPEIQLQSLPKQRITLDTLEHSDLTCPVCFSFIAEPSITPCEHLYCVDCIHKVIEVKSSCPLCRTAIPEDYLPDIASDLQDFAAEKYPDEFNHRKSELIKQKIWFANKMPIVFEYGNTWRRVKNAKVGRHGYLLDNSWTMFVNPVVDSDPTKKLVNKFTYRLHPTYKDPVMNVNEAPFSLTMLAYGSFHVEVTVNWHRALEMPDTKWIHLLRFSEGGSKTNKTVYFDRQSVTDINETGLISKHVVKYEGNKIVGGVSLRLYPGQSQGKSNARRPISAFKRWN